MCTKLTGPIKWKCGHITESSTTVACPEKCGIIKKEEEPAGQTTNRSFNCPAYRDSNRQVIKTTLKHNTKGCSQHVIEHVQHIESISELCIDREKFIYQTLPKNPCILDCLDTEEKGLRFPYYRLGNLRDYLRHNDVDNHVRDRWIGNAIDAVAFIHTYGVTHADISPRNFLVADALSIKLCDFAGSAIGDLRPLVEEDRY
ncbi:hypothetical protein AJ79_08658 [Helicocarpus griseus UAMH5409]|uniref:EKC/KEOPS complex subunit BUD32 n=1 Tax=Helicocarpus griseus UAMH5409 TaxID=1447875 RepID=A0A2B7WRF3_9EURO|nr:hypothetical protein AJ79_08658 [Helicocarpus griseus UAMH5409]